MGKWQRFKEKHRDHWFCRSFKLECIYGHKRTIEPARSRKSFRESWGDFWHSITVWSDRAWKKLVLGHKFYDTEVKKVPEKVEMKQGFFNARVNNMQRDFAARRK